MRANTRNRMPTDYILEKKEALITLAGSIGGALSEWGEHAIKMLIGGIVGALAARGGMWLWDHKIHPKLQKLEKRTTKGPNDKEKKKDKKK